MNDEITAIFDNYIRQHQSLDIAEAEFKKHMHEDPDLHQCYREWCDMVGSSERRGFLDYAEEYIETENDIWDALNDYDE